MGLQFFCHRLAPLSESLLFRTWATPHFAHPCQGCSRMEKRRGCREILDIAITCRKIFAIGDFGTIPHAQDTTQMQTPPPSHNWFLVCVTSQPHPRSPSTAWHPASDVFHCHRTASEYRTETEKYLKVPMLYSYLVLQELCPERRPPPPPPPLLPSSLHSPSPKRSNVLNSVPRGAAKVLMYRLYRP